MGIGLKAELDYLRGRPIDPTCISRIFLWRLKWRSWKKRYANRSGLRHLLEDVAFRLWWRRLMKESKGLDGKVRLPVLLDNLRKVEQQRKD